MPFGSPSYCFRRAALVSRKRIQTVERWLGWLRGDSYVLVQEWFILAQFHDGLVYLCRPASPKIFDAWFLLSVEPGEFFNDRYKVRDSYVFVRLGSWPMNVAADWTSTTLPQDNPANYLPTRMELELLNHNLGPLTDEDWEGE